MCQWKLKLQQHFDQIINHMKKNYKFSKLKRGGYVALITIIIIGAVALSVAISSAILAVAQGRNGLLAQNFSESKGLASACAEKALMDLKENVNYQGDETITLGNGQCQIYQIENLGEEARIIKVTGRVNQVTKKIKIIISQINPIIIFTSWLEVDDF